ncbi:MAG TPA: AbrB/MazE/SpoVT family DNA-binding domain-containing protein [Clostridia bacterium]|nr:AbrB/MazE/SpoVT family DNA-binding domain-containing protein [Clostridia bacterium]
MKMQGPDGRWLFGTVKVGEKGQIVIPKDARDMFNIKPGDMLMIGGDEGAGLAIFTSEVLGGLFAGMISSWGDTSKEEA